MYLCINGRLSVMICVADTIKETSREAVDKLKSMGIKVYMLTGDNRRTAEYIGRQAHVRRSDRRSSAGRIGGSGKPSAKRRQKRL